MQIRLEPRVGGRYVHETGSSTTTSVILPDSKMSFERRPPLMIFDPYSIGWGALLSKPRSIARRPVLCHRVPDARQTGIRLVSDPGGWLALDEVFDSADACERQMLKLADAGNLLHREDTDVREIDGLYYSDRLSGPSIEVPGATFSLLSHEPSNYGSWLFRIIPKLAVAHAMGLTDTKFTCWCPRPFQRELLEFFGVSQHQVHDVLVSKTYLYEELHVPTAPNPEGYLNEMSVDFVRSTLKRHGIIQNKRRCVYISRVSHARSKGRVNVRYFADEEILIKRLEAAGFDIVEPEALNISQQARLFADAAMVVGPSGAALFNTVFCEAGTVVFDIEALPYWLHAHSNYFSSCGHAYAMAFGSADENDVAGSHKSWTIDTDALSDRIIRLRDLVLEHHPYRP